MNTLLIMADQFRGDWMSCAGTDFVNTPNIDKIADRGVRFCSAACNGPLCAPSRSSIAGGVYPHRLGVMSNNENFPIDNETYFRILRKHGYRVSLIGKSDLHKPDRFNGRSGSLPLMYHLGFTDLTETEGKMNACFRMPGPPASGIGFEDFVHDADVPDKALAGPYQKYLMDKGLLLDFANDFNDRLFKKPVWYSGVSVLPAEDYQDSFIGKKACEFLENVNDDSPWHLFVSFVGPHDPWDAPAEYFKRFKNKDFPVPEPVPADSNAAKNKPAWIAKKTNTASAGMSSGDLVNIKRHYAAMITLIDDWIGKMLAILDSKGLREETAVIFTSDHGEMLGDHGQFTKNCMYEAALRVPLIISLPGLQGGRTEHGMAELVDLYPTILDIAGINYDRAGLDGQSLLPVVKENKKIDRELQFSELANTRMIFDGKYKFIENYNDLNELYDLENDPGEQENLLPQNPFIGKTLLRKMREICK
ncbi:MAG: sulfatase-like hydrolase/transferase [Treponema sp.]|nr:sulfatase-like hydrolase/transferase [Treponema sp.]